MANSPSTLEQFTAPTIRICISTGEDGSQIIEDCSEQITELLGYEQDRLIGTPLSQYVTSNETAEGSVQLRTADGDRIPAVGGEQSDGNLILIPLREANDANHEPASQATTSGDPGPEERLDEYRCQVYQLFADRTVDPDTAIGRTLELGSEYLGLELGYTTEVSDGSQTITHVAGIHDTVRQGDTCSLDEAYCKRTIESEEPLCAYAAEVSDEINDRAYDRFELGSYIGKRLIVDGEPYGTVCFAASEPRPVGFSATEQLFVEAISSLIARAIERQQHDRELNSFQQAVEESGDGFAILEDEKYVYTDQTHLDLYGFEDQAALLGNSWRELYEDTEVERLEREMFPALEADGYWQGTTKGQRQDGTVFPVELSLTLLDDGRIVCTVRDRSERYAREQELELYKRAIDEANVGIQITGPADADTPIQYVNSEFERQTGYSADDVLGRNPRFLQGEGADPETVAELHDAIEAGEPVSVELMNYRKDGTPYWNRLSITPVEDDGEPRNFIGIMQDVTERRRRAEKLERQQEKLDVVLSGTKTGIGEWDLRTDELSWDSTLQELFDEPPESVAEFIECAHPDDRHRIEAAVESVLTTGGMATAEYRLLDQQGTITWISVRATAVYEDGRPVQVLATMTEISDQKRIEREAIRASEQVRLFTETVDEYAFVTVDDTGLVTGWNEGAEQLFGFDAETAEGLPAVEVIRAEDGRAVAERLRQQARIGGNSSYTGWLARDDGSPFYADVQYVPTTTGIDDEQQYTIIVHDLTEKYHQQRRTERFVEESVDVISILEPDGTFRYVSGSVETVLGYEAAALLGTNAFDNVHPNDQITAISEFFTTVEEPDHHGKAEIRFEDGEGEWRTIDVRCRNLLDDDAIGGLLVYARDITEAKQRDRRFEAIFNQTYQLTGVLDTDGTWLELNQTAVEISDFDRDHVVGTPVWETPWWSHPDADQERLQEAVERAADGEIVRYETEVLARNGLVVLDFSLKPVLDEYGEVVLLVAEGRDITEQQRQRQHTQVLQRVLRHNIRNDLAKLRGYVELLGETTDPELREQYLGIVNTVLDKWESITTRVAQIQKLLHSQERTHRHVPLDSLVSAVAASATERHPEATIRTAVPESITAELPPALETALLELIDNAVEATATEPRVSLDVIKDDPQWVELVVADNGPGMPEMEAEVLEYGEETPLNHGDSLGLWLVRSIVEQAGGWISVESADEGTTVRLRLRDRPNAAFQRATYLDD